MNKKYKEKEKDEKRIVPFIEDFLRHIEKD